MASFSLVIPAKNESIGLERVLPKIVELYPQVELIVVDDGSSDSTAAVAKSHGAKLVSHPYSKGNGAAIKSGVRAASSDVVVFMDADAQHNPEDIAVLLEKLDQGYDMVVGARKGRSSQASIARWAANSFYNKLASWMVNQPIDDLTSGFRAAHRDKFLEFLYMLPNGFSYPTTSTMAFYRAGYSVGFVPIDVSEREGQSHISPLRDGVRFFLIIFKIGTLYSPLKVFFPLSVGLMAMGLLNYGYTYIERGQFTNMSALLMLSSLLVFVFSLISEQIANLQYRP